MEIENWPVKAQELYEEIQNEFDELEGLIYEHKENRDNPDAWFSAIRKLPHLADLVECLEIEYQKAEAGREIIN